MLRHAAGDAEPDVGASPLVTRELVQTVEILRREITPTLTLMGCPDSASLDGSWLAQAHDVVAVSTNHRLNRFGSLFTDGKQGPLFWT